MFNVPFLNRLRVAEMELVIADLATGARVLELGAGSGAQAAMLVQRGYDVVAIDLPASDYSDVRIFPVMDYDGRRIPLPDHSVDIVFSSNVLEHIEDISNILSEMRRVLKPQGYCVHIIPSVAWRFWTFIAGFPTAVLAMGKLVRDAIAPSPHATRGQWLRRNLKMILGAVLPIGHGTSIEGFSELWTFSSRFWKRRFEKNHFNIRTIRPLGLFHTGHMLFGAMIAPATRKRLASVIGSAATVYIMEPDQN